MAIHDVSIPIRPGMPIYDGNPGFEIELESSISAGAGANISELRIGAHTGTHVDGPSHFIDGDCGTEALSLEAMIGPAVVVELDDVGAGPIDEAALLAAGIPEGAERVLLKTRNSELWSRDEFTRDFVRLDDSAATYLLSRGVQLVGIDYLSIGDPEAHRTLLAAPVVALEGLDLRAVEPGNYQLICLPLRLIGVDGAPARVLLADNGGPG